MPTSRRPSSRASARSRASRLELPTSRPGNNESIWTILTWPARPCGSGDPVHETNAVIVVSEFPLKFIPAQAGTRMSGGPIDAERKCSDAVCHDTRQREALLRGSGAKNGIWHPDRIRARVRRRSPRLGAADARVRKRYRCITYRARLHALRRTRRQGRLQLSRRDARLRGGARSSQDRQGASHRAVHGRLYVLAGRAQSSRPRALHGPSRHRLGLRTLAHGRLPQALACARRPVRARRCAQVAETYGHGPPYHLQAQGPARFRRVHPASRRARLARPANTSRGFQGGRPSLYDFEAEIRKLGPRR